MVVLTETPPVIGGAVLQGFERLEGQGTISLEEYLARREALILEFRRANA